MPATLPERTRNRLPELREAVTAAKAARWLVLTHDNPDPDAIVSAVLLARLLCDKLGEKATVGYGGVLGRAENQALARILPGRVSALERIGQSRGRRIGLVDAQPGSGNSELLRSVRPALVFDHHPPRTPSPHTLFVDVRPDYGATVTILAEYVLAAGLELSPVEATGIAYAIRSETRDFAREYTAADKRIYDIVLPMVDKRALGRIQNAPLDRAHYAALAVALGNMQHTGLLIATHAGPLYQPDLVAEIADLLLRMKGKTWALCTGVYDGRLQVSLRTSNRRADAGAMVRRMIGRKGKGGGHGQRAGGWLALDPTLPATDAHDQLARRLARLLHQKPQWGRVL